MVHQCEATFQLKLFQFTPKVDPCDPATLSKGAPLFPRVQQHGGERTPGKSKAGKAKGKGKKTQEDDRPTAPVRKLWYEARSPEGYTYYWHIETNGAYLCRNFFYLFTRLTLLDMLVSHFSRSRFNSDFYICFLRLCNFHICMFFQFIIYNLYNYFFIFVKTMYFK